MSLSINYILYQVSLVHGKTELTLGEVEKTKISITEDITRFLGELEVKKEELVYNGQKSYIRIASKNKKPCLALPNKTIQLSWVDNNTALTPLNRDDIRFIFELQIKDSIARVICVPYVSQKDGLTQLSWFFPINFQKSPEADEYLKRINETKQLSLPFPVDILSEVRQVVFKKPSEIIRDLGLRFPCDIEFTGYRVTPQKFGNTVSIFLKDVYQGDTPVVLTVSQKNSLGRNFEMNPNSSELSGRITFWRENPVNPSFCPRCSVIFYHTIDF